MVISARLVLFTSVLFGPIAAASAQPATLNDAIVKFCKDNLGKKVGNGECAQLVDEAFKTAGAKSFSRFKDNPGKDDYVWGELVLFLEVKDEKREKKMPAGTSIKPGDVIQFRDARFQGKNYFAVCVHHTAVVIEVKEQDKVLFVLEQNANGKKLVTEKTYRLDDLKAGWIRVYRPEAK